MLGTDWFVVVLADAWLYGKVETTSAEFAKIAPQLTAAVRFAITDQLTPQEKRQVLYVRAEFLDSRVRPTNTSSRRNPSATAAAAAAAAEGEQSEINYDCHLSLAVYCNSTAVGRQVHDAFVDINTEPLRLVLTLHNQGLFFVTNARVGNARIVRTREGPPTTPEVVPLSPVRIIWIIIGTIVGFTLGVRG